MLKAPRINVMVIGLDNPAVMDSFYNNISRFWSNEVHKRVNMLDISRDEKLKLINSIFNKIS